MCVCLCVGSGFPSQLANLVQDGGGNRQMMPSPRGGMEPGVMSPEYSGLTQTPRSTLSIPIPK